MILYQIKEGGLHLTIKGGRLLLNKKGDINVLEKKINFLLLSKHARKQRKYLNYLNLTL